MEQHRHGNTRVFYDTEGRVYYQGHDSKSTDQWPGSARSAGNGFSDYHYHSYDPIRDEKRKKRKSKSQNINNITQSVEALPGVAVHRVDDYGHRHGYNHSLGSDLEGETKVTKTIIHHHVVEDKPEPFYRDGNGYRGFQDLPRRYDSRREMPNYRSPPPRDLQRERDVHYHKREREQPAPYERYLPPAIPARPPLPSPPPPPAPPPPRPPTTVMDRPDWMAPGFMYDKGHVVAERHHHMDSGVVVKRRILTEERPISWVFIGTGVLLIVLGVLNTLFCVEYHYYCHLWVGFLVLELGLFGQAHKGNYRSRWKNWTYIITGVVVNVAVMVGVAIISSTLALTIIELAINKNNLDSYLKNEVLNNRPWPHVNISANVEDYVWTCLSFDCITTLFFLIDFLSLAAAAIVADHFWNANYDFTHKIEPFCRPRMFNPYHQMSVGQSIAFCGIVTVFATRGTEWHLWWSPVWAAVLAVIAGGMTAAAGKRHDLKRLSTAAIIIQSINLLASVAAIALCTLGMVDDINSIVEAGDPDSVTTAQGMKAEFEKQWLTASACIFAVADMMLMINVFYSLALLFRLIRYLSSRPSKYGRERHYSHSSDFTPIDEMAQVAYGKPYGRTPYDHQVRSPQYDPYDNRLRRY